MPVDPRISRYMMENGYKDLANFPEPSQMLRMAKSPNPAINITRGLLSAVEQIALAGIKKKATGKNEEAAKKTEERISAEDMMQFRAKIDQLRQNGFDDLAAAAEITGELPKNSEIIKVLNDRKQQQQDQQAEQTAMSPIQAAQQAAQIRMPADQTPMLSKDFQNPMGGGLPAGPQSARPEELLAMSQGNVSGAMEKGRSLQQDFGGDLLSAIDKWSQPDNKETLDNQLRQVWGEYSNGDIDLETAQARAIKIKNAMTGSSTMTQGEREAWRASGKAMTADSSDAKFDRQKESEQSNRITTLFMAAQARYEDKKLKYDTALAKWEAMTKGKPSASKYFPKPVAPKEIGTFDEYVDQFKDKLPYGYDFLKRLKETDEPQSKTDEELLDMNPEDMSDEELDRFLEMTGE